MSDDEKRLRWPNSQYCENCMRCCNRRPPPFGPGGFEAFPLGDVCLYCSDSPPWHHGRCCPNHPRNRHTRHDATYIDVEEILEEEQNPQGLDVEPLQETEGSLPLHELQGPERREVQVTVFDTVTGKQLGDQRETSGVSVQRTLLSSMLSTSSASASSFAQAGPANGGRQGVLQPLHLAPCSLDPDP